jgi:hypothetical protein
VPNCRAASRVGGVESSRSNVNERSSCATIRAHGTPPSTASQRNPAASSAKNPGGALLLDLTKSATWATRQSDHHCHEPIPQRRWHIRHHNRLDLRQ